MGAGKTKPAAKRASPSVTRSRTKPEAKKTLHHHTYPPATAKSLIDASLVNPNNNDKHPKFSRLSMEDQGGFRNLKLPFSNAKDSIGEVRESVGVGDRISPHSRNSSRTSFVAERGDPSAGARRFCVNCAPPRLGRIVEIRIGKTGSNDQCFSGDYQLPCPLPYHVELDWVGVTQRIIWA